MFHEDTALDRITLWQDGGGDAEQILQREGTSTEDIFQSWRCWL